MQVNFPYYKQSVLYVKKCVFLDIIPGGRFCEMIFYLHPVQDRISAQAALKVRM